MTWKWIAVMFAEAQALEPSTAFQAHEQGAGLEPEQREIELTLQYGMWHTKQQSSQL